MDGAVHPNTRNPGHSSRPRPLLAGLGFFRVLCWVGSSLVGHPGLNLDGSLWLLVHGKSPSFRCRLPTAASCTPPEGSTGIPPSRRVSAGSWRAPVCALPGWGTRRLPQAARPDGPPEALASPPLPGEGEVPGHREHHAASPEQVWNAG